MNRKFIKITISFIVLIVILIFFVIDRRNPHLKVPDSKKISNIILINVINDEPIEKTIINNELDIAKLLEILKNSERTGKESISNFPDKSNFTAVLFHFKSNNSKSLRSIYEENNIFYIDQPFDGVYELRADDLYELNQIVKRGSKENISIELDDILKNKF